MKIFLTGSEGFIGSHLAEKLVKNGHDLTCLVLYNSLNSWGWLDKINEKVKKNIRVVTGDIRDEFAINKIIRKNTEVIINLAALIGIPYSYRSPKSYFETNSIGLMNILNLSINSNVQKIIHVSTSEVYGTPKKVPIKENSPINAQSPYAASKVAADQLALSFYKSYGLPVSVIRPFNTYGPRQSTRAIIPTIITQALKNDKIEIGSLFPKRDLLFVEDTVEGIISAIGNKKSIGNIINIGSGYEISIKDLANKICKILRTNKTLKSKKIRKRPNKSEVMRLLASIQKAKKILRWSPKIKGAKGLEAGLVKTINWYKKKENLKLFKTSNFSY